MRRAQLRDASVWRNRFAVRIVAAFCVVTAAAAYGGETNALDAYLFPNDDALTSSTALPTAPQLYWLADPELRITQDRDESKLHVQTYRLRLHPTSSTQRATTTALFNAENALNELQSKKSQSAALANRYHRLIDLAEQEARFALAQQQLALDRRVLGAERAQAAGSRYSAARLENAVTRVAQRGRELQRDLDRINALRAATIGPQLAVAGDTDQPQVSRRLVQPPVIDAEVERIAALATSSTFANALAQLELQRATHEEKLARSENSFGLSLFELSHQSQRVDSYAVTVGFRLPFARNAYDSQRRAREVVVAQQHVQLTQQTSAAQISDAVRELRWKLKAHAADNAALQALVQRIASIKSTNAASDASTFASLRQYQLDLCASAVDMHIRALHEFVALLDVAALLQQPNKNWIRETAAD